MVADADLVKAYKDGMTVSQVAEKYGVGDHYVFNRVKGLRSKRGPQVKWNEDFFEKIDSEEKAYWLGFLMADGSVVVRARENKYCMSVGLQIRDRGALEKLLCVVGRGVGLLRERDGRYVYCSLCSKKLCLDLISHGVVSNKSSGSDLYVVGVPEELLRHFWRGFFDGDGWITYCGRDRVTLLVGFGGVSEPLLNQLNEFLVRKGIVLKGKFLSVHLRGDDRLPFYVLKGYARNAEKILDLLYEGSTVSLDRKRQRWVDNVALRGVKRVRKKWGSNRLGLSVVQLIS